MEKKQRNILIAVISGTCVLAIFIMVGRFFLIGGALQEILGGTFTFAANKETVITELNQPYQGNNIRIIATDIKSINTSSSNEQIIIGVKLVVENTSDKEEYLGPSLITAYVDDTTTQRISSGDFDKDGEGLFGEIAPGKRMTGYYCVNASKNARQIELQISESYFFTNKQKVVFIFDIPPVEE